MNVEPSAKGRLIQTFKFLKELTELRNPVPRDMTGYPQVLRLNSWPVHPCITVRRGDPDEEDDQDTTEAELEPLVRIQRAQLTSCPKPPRVLDGWLRPGWEAVEAKAEVLPSRNFPDKEKGSITVEFGADEERSNALGVWEVARTRWVIAERPAVSARQLFEKIYGLWTSMQREGDRVELVLADGMLTVGEQLIKHPVLLQRVNLEFDPSTPEFRFVTETGKVELHRALLRLVPTIEGRMIAHFDKELEAEPVGPLGGERAEGFFRRLVQGLFNDGEFLEDDALGADTNRPCIWREPVIFVRPRTAGLSTTLDCTIEDLEKETTEVSEGLARVVGIETMAAKPASAGISEGERQPTPTAQERDILFSKAANAEQYEIAARLAQAKSIVVQGPPGTGKTHTIANLLGHLLSQGRTALVTAHTTKALRVLRGLMDEALQPLCLSVLEGDSGSQAQLSRAAQDIASRLSGSNAASLRREAAVLRDKRNNLLGVAEVLRRKLRDARFSEIEEVVVGGEGLSPINAAKRVKANAEIDSWIPGPLEPGVLCPLTDAQVRQLYASQDILTAEAEKQLAVSQPTLAELVASVDFRARKAEQVGADSRAQSHRPEFWDESTTAACSATQLQKLYQRINYSAATLNEEQTWLREVLFAGWTGGGLAETWQDLLAAMETLSNEAGTARRLMALVHGS